VSGESRIDPDERRPRGDVDHGAPSRGARTVSAILPNGRVVWLRIDPPLAPAAAVNQLAQVVEHTARWRRAAAHTQGEAVARLSRTVASDAERMIDGHLERARVLRRRIVAGDRKVAQKLAKAAEEYRSRVERQLRIERETVRRLGRRDLWDQIVIATALPLFAAYGQPGRPFGANNVTLALSLLIWLVGDEIVDALFGSEEASPYPLRDADAWSYLAPVGNLLAGWWLLNDLQHERFITSRVAIPPDPLKWDAKASGGAPGLIYTARIGLSPFMGSEHFADFKTFTDVPAVATIGSIRRTAAGAAQIQLLDARVRNGDLMIRLKAVAPGGSGSPGPLFDVLEVAWMVDTQQPETATPGS
jgi:hypothetical protein